MFNNSLGGQGFTWFIGVVEQRTDPLKMGRVRVRCFGYHTDDKDLIPTEELPWATVVNSIDSASISGIGKSPTGIVEGSWVMGFFLDGQDAQTPMILGTIPSMSSSLPDTTKGFNDPNGVYPQVANESDVNRLARGIDKITTPTDSLISEPASYFNSSYPYNHVFESESGHVKEYDDTEGAERIREYHKSGTYYEVHPDGSKSTHVVSDNYKVVVGDESVHISGDVKVYIDGDATLNIQGDYNTFVGGKTNIVSAGDMRLVAPRIDLNPNEESQDVEATKRVVGGNERYLGSVDGVQGVAFPPTCEVSEKEQYDYAVKIYDEVFAKLDWKTNPKELIETWVTAANNYYKQEKIDTVVTYYEEDGTDPLKLGDYLSRRLINRARVRKLEEPTITEKDMGLIRFQADQKNNDGSRHLSNTYYYYYPNQYSSVLKESFFLEMIAKALDNSNCKELYDVLSNLIFKRSNPEIYLNSEMRKITVENVSDTTTHTDLLGSPQVTLGGMWIPGLDKTQLAFTSTDPLQTLVHELLGHRNHSGNWGIDGVLGNRVLLSKEEVKALKDGFSENNIFNNKAKIEANPFLKKFQNIKQYPEDQVEDEALARIFAHLATHRCTDFTKDCYAPLNSMGIKFSMATVQEIDKEMRNLGLTVNRNEWKDYSKTVSYYEGTQSKLITASLDDYEPIVIVDTF